MWKLLLIALLGVSAEAQVDDYTLDRRFRVEEILGEYPEGVDRPKVCDIVTSNYTKWLEFQTTVSESPRVTYGGPSFPNKLVKIDEPLHEGLRRAVTVQNVAFTAAYQNGVLKLQYTFDFGDLTKEYLVEIFTKSSILEATRIQLNETGSNGNLRRIKCVEAPIS